MSVINTNITSMERLSSGLRINIANRMTAQINDNLQRIPARSQPASTVPMC